ncbi:hypothetical protein ASE04_17725 [Rhizobium sp. Root708]|nr:hypothetical protein ASE04_17725 [Rhizobium sp. Root708]
MIEPPALAAFSCRATLQLLPLLAAIPFQTRLDDTPFTAERTEGHTSVCHALSILLVERESPAISDGALVGSMKTA